MQIFTNINNGFNCPMMNKMISKDITPNFITCINCKFNILKQFIDNTCYCGYSSTNNSSSSQNPISEEAFWDEFKD